MEDCDNAFHTLRKYLITAPILAHPTPSGVCVGQLVPSFPRSKGEWRGGLHTRAEHWRKQREITVSLVMNYLLWYNEGSSLWELTMDLADFKIWNGTLVSNSEHLWLWSRVPSSQATWKCRWFVVMTNTQEDAFCDVVTRTTTQNLEPGTELLPQEQDPWIAGMTREEI